MGRHRRLLPLILIVFLLVACSGPDLINAFVSREGYHVMRDLRYGDGPRRRLDLYIPQATAGTTPTIVFFYGGDWQSGSKGDYLFVGEAFASRGYVTVIPDYRLYPEVRYPAFLEDAAAAVAWVRDNTGQTGVKARPIYLVGHSAGAYIAVMLTLDSDWLAQAGERVCATVAAVVGLAGPYDFLPLKSEKLRDIFGPEPSRPPTQPINHVDGTAPPLLLISGGDDTTVRPGNTGRLAARIRSAGGTADVRYYGDIGHIALIASLARPLGSLAPTLDDIDVFLRQHPHTGDAGCRGVAEAPQAPTRNNERR